MKAIKEVPPAIVARRRTPMGKPKLATKFLKAIG